MIGIVDYNAGNIKSVERALTYLKADFIVSKNPHDLETVDKLIFPGVGEAKYAMDQLKKTGFDIFLKTYAQRGKPLLGICLGSQIIFDYSEESDTTCLGLIKGNIKHFSTVFNEQKLVQETISKIKIPHMGWNNLELVNSNDILFSGIPLNSSFYFVHSYLIQPENSSVVTAYADYGVKVPAAIHDKNIYAFQFHPEKSGKCGLKLLSNFILSNNL